MCFSIFNRERDRKSDYYFERVIIFGYNFYGKESKGSVNL